MPKQNGGLSKPLAGHVGVPESWQKALQASLGILIALQTLFLAFTISPITNDSARYISLSDSLRHGNFQTFSLGYWHPEVQRAPGYPLFLLASRYGLHLSIRGIAVLEGLLYLLAVALIYRLLVEREVNATAFLALVFLYPATAAYSVRIMTEALVILSFAVLAWIVTRRMQPGPGLFVLAGIVSGFLTLVRPDAMLLIPLMAALLFFRVRNWQALAVPVLTAFLVLAPYVAWNWRTFHRPLPTARATGLGNSLYLAYWEAYVPSEDLSAFSRREVTSAAIQSGYAAEAAKINQALGVPSWSDPANTELMPTLQSQLAAGPALLRDALQLIWHRPWPYVSHVVLAWYHLFNPAAYPMRSPFAVMLLRVASALIWALGILGLILLYRDRAIWALPLIALMLYSPLTHCFLHTEARFTAGSRLLLVAVASYVFTRVNRRQLGSESQRVGKVRAQVPV